MFRQLMRTVKPSTSKTLGVLSRVGPRAFCEHSKPSDAVIERKFKTMRGTGDKGQSSLFTGERRWKDDEVFEALGAVDELSAAIGQVVLQLKCHHAIVTQLFRKMRYMCDEHGLFDVTGKLIQIQCTLQDLCSHVATPAQESVPQAKLDYTQFDEGFVQELDEWIDYFANELPPLKQFILPGGNLLSSCMHEARCISRRAERSLIPLLRQKQISTSALQYINRLSDLLFVLGRYICQHTKSEEISYKKRNPHDELGEAGLKTRHNWKKYKI